MSKGRDAQTHSTSLSTRDLEDDLEYSTSPSERPVRRYTSAAHALAAYLKLRHPPALDAERVAAPTGDPPGPDAYICDQYEQARLAVCFQRAQRSVSRDRWRIWFGLRIDLRAVRDFDASKGEVYRATKDVEGAIERELQREGLLVRVAVRDEDDRELPSWVEGAPA